MYGSMREKLRANAAAVPGQPAQQNAAAANMANVAVGLGVQPPAVRLNQLQNANAPPRHARQEVRQDMQQHNNNNNNGLGYPGVHLRNDVIAAGGFGAVGGVGAPPGQANNAAVGGVFGAALLPLARPEARQDPPPNAICRALKNVGLDYTAFKRASINPDLSDEDLLALPDMPWDWAQISKHKRSLQEETLITLSDKDWNYKDLSRLHWSDDIIAALRGKDWDYIALSTHSLGAKSADLLVQTTTKSWDWPQQLSALLMFPVPQQKAAVHELLRKSLLKSDEVVWDWHKAFENRRLANALLAIALEEIPKYPSEPWDYEKLSSAWWYPIDALLSLGVDKPWDMDMVSAREDLTTDHVFKLFPDAMWNYDITDKNPHVMRATRKRQELLRARDIILKIASRSPDGRLFLRQKKVFQDRLL